MIIATIVVVLGLVGWAVQVLLTLQTYESRRYARRRVRPATMSSRKETADTHRADSVQRVTLIVPCKGFDLDGERNLAALLQQDHPSFEVAFVVESESDRAHRVIERMRTRYSRVSSRIVLAGRCYESAQKVHNLIKATEELPVETAVLAFADSDACPPSDWLRNLVTRLDEPWTGAVTGYRWFVPKDNRLPNLTLYSINSALAGLLGPGNHYVVWGGAWAIRRDVFEAIDIQNAWRGTLSDDLVANRALREANLEVRFEPNCVVTTSVDFTWSSAVEFAQRQYRISRLYLKRWWALAVVSSLATQVAFWGQLGLAVSADHLRLWQRAVLVGSSVGLAGMTIFRAKLRQDLVKVYTPENANRLQIARRFDTWAAPLVAIANLLILFSSAVGRRIRWRGISYLVSAEGRSQLLGRQFEADAEPVILKFPTDVERRSKPTSPVGQTMVSSTGHTPHQALARKAA